MSKIQELMQQEISRKEFLRYIGIALLGMAGVTAFLQNLSGSFNQPKQVEQKKGSGYGYSAYGR